MQNVTGLLIACPSYNDTISVPTMKGIIELSLLLKKEKIPYNFFNVSGDSLVCRARNMVIASFIKTGFSHMIFIDTDIGFTPNDVLKMMATGHEVVGGFYPKKKLCFDSIAQKAKGGSGHPYEYVTTLEGTKFNLNKGCIEVKEIGTGFLMLRRTAIDKLIKAYPNLKYKTQYCTPEQNPEDFYAFFDTAIVDDIYLSEDYYLCHLWRKLGNKVYGFIDAKLTHTGGFYYEGDLRAILTIKNNEQEKPLEKPVEKPINKPASIRPKLTDPLFVFG